MAQQNFIWQPNFINFNGMDVATRDEIEDDLFNTFDNPDFAPVFHQKIKEALNGRRHAQNLPPYDNNHFQAGLNAFLIDEGIYPNLIIPLPETAAENVATEGDAEAVQTAVETSPAIQAAPAMGGRRKRATRKRATRKRATKRRGRKQRKTKKHSKRK